MTDKIAELKAETQRLTALLDAPEPGLITWWQMVTDSVNYLQGRLQVAAEPTVTTTTHGNPLTVTITTNPEEPTL